MGYGFNVASNILKSARRILQINRDSTLFNLYAQQQSYKGIPEELHFDSSMPVPSLSLNEHAFQFEKWYSRHNEKGKVEVAGGGVEENGGGGGRSKVEGGGECGRK
ncbi:hypothetical protein LguiA_024750 [Lonicera macranthoides]